MLPCQKLGKLFVFVYIKLATAMFKGVPEYSPVRQTQSLIVSRSQQVLYQGSAPGIWSVTPGRLESRQTE